MAEVERRRPKEKKFVKYLDFRSRILILANDQKLAEKNTQNCTISSCFFPNLSGTFEEKFELIFDYCPALKSATELAKGASL